MKNKKIFIAGIPGTGKTTVGDFLSTKHYFTHYNFESSNSCKQYLDSPEDFLSSLNSDKVVITWGFPPNGDIISAVLRLKNDGFQIFWFDGDRIAAFREFMRRENKNEQMQKTFFYQMYKILESNVVSILDPHLVNTFDEDGNFKRLDEICTIILKRL